MVKKLTEKSLALEEKKLELQERKALLKENKEKLLIDKEYLKLNKADVLNRALTSIYIKNEGEPLNKTEEYGFSNTEFLFLIKKYYELLKSI